MRKIIFLTLFWGFYSTVYGNTTQIDSLIQTLETTTSLAEKAKINHELSVVYINTDLSKAISYFKAGNKILKENSFEDLTGPYLKQEASLYLEQKKYDSSALSLDSLRRYLAASPDDDLLFSVYQIRGVSEGRRGNLDSSLVYFGEAGKIAEKMNDREKLASIYRNQASISHRLAYYEDALSYYHKSLDALILETREDSFALLLSWDGIGKTHLSLDNDSLALAFFMKTLDFSQRIGDKRYVTRTMITIGSTLLNQFKLTDSALFYFQKAIPIAEEIQDFRQLFLVYANIASIHVINEDSHEALLAYQKVEPYLRKLNINDQETRRYWIAYRMAVGNILRMEKRYEEAEDYIMASLESARKEDKKNHVMDAYYRLTLLYEDAGELQKSLDYFKKFINLRDSIYSSTRGVKLAEMEAKYQAEKKEREIADLKTQAVSQELEVVKKNQQLVVLVGILALVILGSGFLFSFFRRKKEEEKKHALRQIENQQIQIQQLIEEQGMKSIEAMIEGQEIERERIARDLHDRLGSTMSMIKLHFSETIDQLREIQEVNTNNYLIINDLVDEAIVEVRRISHNMSAGTLMEYGLVSALNELKHTIEKSQRIELGLHVYNLDFRLKSTAEINLYRVIQELINNTLKHADASRIEISLTRREDVLSLMYDDNGKGIEMEDGSFFSGMGQKNIKSRIEKLGGKIHVYSGLDKGMHYDIEVPISLSTD